MMTAAFVLLAIFLAACVLNSFMFIDLIPQDLHQLTRRSARITSTPQHYNRKAAMDLSFAASVPPPLPNPVASERVAGCKDAETQCRMWARKNGCLDNPEFMLTSCKDACGLCDRQYLITVPQKVRIGSNSSMPLVGLGTAGMGKHTQQLVQWAIDAGYRLIDSAQAPEWYREDLVGAALRDSGVDRGSLFLTSKLHPQHHGYNSATVRLEMSVRVDISVVPMQTLEMLGTDYLDMMLLHYPECWGSLCGSDPPEGTWRDSWRAFEHALRQGKLRALGVSNFNLEQLQELRRMADFQPAVVQSHCDPLSQATTLRAYCRLAGIHFQAYSSLGTQWLMQGHKQNPVLTNPVIKGTAAAVNRSAAQVVLRWALQSGQAVVPQSSNRAHMESNLQLRDFFLTPQQLLQIDTLDGSLT